MKKILSVVLALAMVMALCCSAAFATDDHDHKIDSKSTAWDLLSAVDATGKKVQVRVCDHEVPPLTVEEASRIILANNAQIKDATPGNLAIIHNECLHAEDAVFPVTMTFKTDSDVPLYVFHYSYDASEWQLVGYGDHGTAEAVFDSLSPVALVVEKEQDNGKKDDTKKDDTTKKSSSSKKSTSGKSPKTGESSALLVSGGIAVAAGAVALIARKKED